MESKEKEEIRNEILKDLERHERVKKEGYAGVMPSGHIVDRRIYPDAIPIQDKEPEQGVF